ncbi:hypothetical protein B0H19DRAFT_1259162 [Mycena capillaripes]|nr:hypothetical protein B0H19DRAFT_1259162 [Mycena capillaripes]
MHGGELLKSVGMEGSDRYLGILDLRAEIHSQKSEYLEARQLYAEMVKRTSPVCSPQYHAHSLCSLVAMDILAEGEVADIISNLTAAETVYATLGSPRNIVCSWAAAELKLYCGDTENARVALLECLLKSRDTFPALAGCCLAALADPAHRMHGVMDTFRWAVIYLAFVNNNKDAVGVLYALRRLADVHVALGDDETALHLFDTALQGRTKMDIHRIRAECMVGIGEIILRRGNPIQAREMWAPAHPLFVRSSRMRDAASVERRLDRSSHTQQQDHPQTHQVIENGGLGQSTGTSSMVSTASNNEPDIAESSLHKLETLSAPNTSPSLQAQTADNLVTSTDRHAKLSVL